MSELRRYFENRLQSAEADAKSQRASAESSAAELRSELERCRAQGEREAAQVGELRASSAAKDEALAAKEKALSRALSNYKEELLRWTSRLRELEESKVTDARTWQGKLEAMDIESAQRLEELEERHAHDLCQAREDAELELRSWKERLRSAEQSGEADTAQSDRVDPLDGRLV